MFACQDDYAKSGAVTKWLHLHGYGTEGRLFESMSAAVSEWLDLHGYLILNFILRPFL